MKTETRKQVTTIEVTEVTKYITRVVKYISVAYKTTYNGNPVTFINNVVFHDDKYAPSEWEFRYDLGRILSQLGISYGVSCTGHLYALDNIFLNIEQEGEYAGWLKLTVIKSVKK